MVSKAEILGVLLSLEDSVANSVYTKLTDIVSNSLLSLNNIIEEIKRNKIQLNAKQVKQLEDFVQTLCSIADALKNYKRYIRPLVTIELV